MTPSFTRFMAPTPDLSIVIPAYNEESRIEPTVREIVAYCRGPQCVMAIEAVELLRKRGFRAHRLEQGVMDWRARGWRIEKSASED